MLVLHFNAVSVLLCNGLLKQTSRTDNRTLFMVFS